MRTGRSISMDSAVWTEIGKISENETSDDVSAAIEMLCQEALKSRDGEMMLSDEAAKVIDDHMDAHGFETRYLALQDILLKFDELRAEHDTREAMMPAED